MIDKVNLSYCGQNVRNLGPSECLTGVLCCIMSLCYDYYMDPSVMYILFDQTTYTFEGKGVSSNQFALT